MLEKHKKNSKKNRKNKKINNQKKIFELLGGAGFIPNTMDMLVEPISEDADDNWEIIRNKGDGHCFYHTILRFIYDNFESFILY